ncbi:MAG: hypothetical protein WBA43_23035 [Elainellaceae cyanobacterium]
MMPTSGATLAWATPSSYGQRHRADCFPPRYRVLTLQSKSDRFRVSDT